MMEDKKGNAHVNNINIIGDLKKKKMKEDFLVWLALSLMM
jgi:hypothetical protein